jgi:hypothetical protein
LHPQRSYNTCPPSDAKLGKEEEFEMSQDTSLRHHLLELLRGGHAHIQFDDVVKDFPLDRAGLRRPGAPHSAWELLEHMRIAQNDILRFSRESDYASPAFPDGYWPRSPAPESGKMWDDSVRAFRNDLAAFEQLIQDSSQDLLKPFPWGEGQTLLREALLIADHNAYHLGQLMLVRRLVSQG